MAESFPEIMTIEETSRYLRIPLSSLYQLARSGRIPCQKVGRHWRFYRPAILKWIAGQARFENRPSTPEKLDFS